MEKLKKQKKTKEQKNHETLEKTRLSTSSDNFAQPEVVGIYIYIYVRLWILSVLPGHEQIVSFGTDVFLVSSIVS